MRFFSYYRALVDMNYLLQKVAIKEIQPLRLSSRMFIYHFSVSFDTINSCIPR